MFEASKFDIAWKLREAASLIMGKRYAEEPMQKRRCSGLMKTGGSAHSGLALRLLPTKPGPPILKMGVRMPPDPTRAGGIRMFFTH
jgi:hypothetical protein